MNASGGEDDRSCKVRQAKRLDPKVPASSISFMEIH
ncbi:uncharacterized protein G2W53_043909 [Senna tora]|uniref:Uncharacterized protein n=1 Tax=Senna tora TaxID=362788 RepID=A0A834W0J5_9FABA|nr:uncharacterized protein G2W53_043909 [Senna tora]